MKASLKNAIEEVGFSVVPGVLSRDECRALLSLLIQYERPPEWAKGCAARWPRYYEIGADRRIVDHVTRVLGNDVILWGASLVRRPPGKRHPWHTDIETSQADCRTLSVWIGLENTISETALRAISYSHAFGTTVQEHSHRENRLREALTDSEVLAWAKRYHERSEIEVLDVSDGDAVFFDGRLWHGTHNTNGATRTALLLQYATPDTPIRIPDNRGFEWPVKFLDEPRPRCVLVSGSSRSDENRIVPAPVAPAGTDGVLGWIKQFDLPLEESPEAGWKPYPIYRGGTGTMSKLSVHASVLSAGHTPHPPHRHDEEEVLLVLGGQPELVLVDEEGNRTQHPVRRGHFAYYPAGQLHTITNPGPAPATYLMYKWEASGSGRNGHDPLATSIFDPADHEPTPAAGRSFNTKKVFDGPTVHLHKLHCHLTSLEPGGGYDEHVDAYDVAIVILEGAVETLGRRVTSDGVIFYAAGEPHGMKNVGDVPARYVVFEFHGTAAPKNGPQETPSISRRIKKRARRVVRGVRRRLRRLASHR